MCCFSQDVGLVSNTNIFARGNNGTQYLVYQMTYSAADELAMVLPLPVLSQTRDDAVRFINLESYPSFFEDMQLGFSSHSLAETACVVEPELTVHEVGMFEASFVPTIADFSRLDSRFRIPEQVGAKLPAYQDYGFAVFKLKPASDPQEIHPMAFEFPRRNRDLLYFPTLHIHDGDIHSEAQFDHMLYCQPDEAAKKYLTDWHRSQFSAEVFIDIAAAQGIVAPHFDVWQLPLYGVRTNTDALIGNGGCVPKAVQTI